MNVNWNSYRLFYYVAYYGSTSMASRKLFVSQPSISRGIKHLEEHLNCRLFERSFHGMEMTEAGKILFEHIGRAISSIESAEEYLMRMQTENQTTVNIAVIDTTLQFFLLSHLETFREKNPHIFVNIHQCANVPDAENLIDSHAADFAVMCEPSGRADLISIPVKKVSDVLVCSAAYGDAVNATVLSVQQLKEFPVIMHCKNSPSRTLIDDFLHKNGVDLLPKYEFTHVSSIIRQIKTEFALALVLENTIRDELDAGSLIEIELDPPIPHRFYYLIKPKKIHTRAAYSLAEFLENAADL